MPGGIRAMKTKTKFFCDGCGSIFRRIGKARYIETARGPQPYIYSQRVCCHTCRTRGQTHPRILIECYEADPKSVGRWSPDVRTASVHVELRQGPGQPGAAQPLQDHHTSEIFQGPDQELDRTDSPEGGAEVGEEVS